MFIISVSKNVSRMTAVKRTAVIETLQPLFSFSLWLNKLTITWKVRTVVTFVYQMMVPNMVIECLEFLELQRKNGSD